MRNALTGMNCPAQKHLPVRMCLRRKYWRALRARRIRTAPLCTASTTQAHVSTPREDDANTFPGMNMALSPGLGDVWDIPITPDALRAEASVESARIADVKQFQHALGRCK